MQLQINDAEPEFRAKIRAFLKESLPPELANQPTAVEPIDLSVQDRWYDVIHPQGWSMPSWPVENGGTGWSVEQLHIFNEEMGAAGAPPTHAFANLVGPVLCRFGTPEQQAKHIPGLLDGSVRWCQGFSEPDNGSDLAGLKTRAVREGDQYVVNGSKIWTTFGHRAQWMFCLVRTSTEGKPQTGISFLLIDMSTPGIKVRPITSIDGLHHLNQVFFDDVKVPAENRIGEENKGWDYAKFLLEVERFGSAPIGALKGKLAQIRRIADDPQQRAIDDPAFRHRLAELEVEVLALEALALRQLSAKDALLRNAGANMLKLLGTQLQQRATELAVEASGVYAQVDQVQSLLPGSNEEILGPQEGPDAVMSYFFGRAATIYGGTSEVQKNIIFRQLSR